MSKEEDIKVYLEKLDKKALIDLYLQKCFDKDVEISDLEAKLTESEKQIKDARELGIEQFHSLKEIINFSQEEIDKFKQQLAEKDEEIEELNDKLEWKSKWLKIADNMVRHYEKSNQDKILFAVEQLEKVKKFFLEEHRDEEMDTDYIITKDAGEIADYLLDQIKQLKEGK